MTNDRILSGRIRKSVVEAAARRVRRLSKPGTPERLFTIIEVERDLALTKPERHALSDTLIRLSNDAQAYGRTGGKPKVIR